MPRLKPPPHSHKSHRNGWLRAAVLGANDGIVSTASLVIGVAAAGVEQHAVWLTGCAGLIAGAMSMAAGEYVSVSSQADTEKADLAMEARALKRNYRAEINELAGIYRERGLTPELAQQVANQLMEHDALAAHARDEIGITATSAAKPLQAAFSSALLFMLGAALPLLCVLLAPAGFIAHWVAVISLLSLVLLGWLSAVVGGAPVLPAMARVAFWGVAAMLLTAAAGHLVGTGV